MYNYFILIYVSFVRGLALNVSKQDCSQHTWNTQLIHLDKQTTGNVHLSVASRPGARPTKHISIEFEIR